MSVATPDAVDVSPRSADGGTSAGGGGGDEPPTVALSRSASHDGATQPTHTYRGRAVTESGSGVRTPASSPGVHQPLPTPLWLRTDAHGRGSGTGSGGGRPGAHDNTGVGGGGRARRPARTLSAVGFTTSPAALLAGTQLHSPERGTPRIPQHAPGAAVAAGRAQSPSSSDGDGSGAADDDGTHNDAWRAALDAGLAAACPASPAPARRRARTPPDAAPARGASPPARTVSGGTAAGSAGEGGSSSAGGGTAREHSAESMDDAASDRADATPGDLLFGRRRVSGPHDPNSITALLDAQLAATAAAQTEGLRRASPGGSGRVRAPSPPLLDSDTITGRVGAPAVPSRHGRRRDSSMDSGDGDDDTSAGSTSTSTSGAGAQSPAAARDAGSASAARISPPPVARKRRNRARRLWARVRSVLSRSTPMTEKLMQARDILRTYDRTLRASIKQKMMEAVTAERQRAQVRFSNYAELRKLYRRGLFMFLSSAKRRAELCLQAGEQRRVALQLAVTALELRLRDTATLLEVLEMQLKAEREKSSSGESARQSAVDDPAATYAAFAKPPMEVIRNDREVGAAVSKLAATEHKLEKAEEALMQLNRMSRQPTYKERRARLLRVLQRELEEPTVPQVLKDYQARMAAITRALAAAAGGDSDYASDAAPVPEIAVRDRQGSASSFNASVVGSVTIGSDAGSVRTRPRHRRDGSSGGGGGGAGAVAGSGADGVVAADAGPHDAAPSGGADAKPERAAGDAKAHARAAEAPAAAPRRRSKPHRTASAARPRRAPRPKRGPDARLFSCNRVHAVASLCCDTRLPEGRLLTRWCNSILAGAARLHEFQNIKFGGDTVKKLLTEDDMGAFPHRHRHVTARQRRQVASGSGAPSGRSDSGLAPNDSTWEGSGGGRTRSASLLRLNQRRASASKTGALALLNAAGSAQLATPSPAQDARQRPKSMAVKGSARVAARTGPASAGGRSSQRVRRANGDRAELALENQLPTPGFILFFLRYFTRTMLTVYGVDEEGAHMSAPMRGLVDRVVYPRILRLCFAFNNSRTARWDRLFARNVHSVRLMSAADIGVEESFRAACTVLDGDDVAGGADWEPRALFTAPAALLSRLPEQQVPSDMMQVLLASVRGALEEAAIRARDPAVAHTMDAETMFPILVYLCSRATWKRPNRYLAFLTEFAITRRKVGGVEDYFVTAMAAAVAWVCRRNAMRRQETKAVLARDDREDSLLETSFSDDQSDGASDDEFADLLPKVGTAHLTSAQGNPGNGETGDHPQPAPLTRSDAAAAVIASAAASLRPMLADDVDHGIYEAFGDDGGHGATPASTKASGGAPGAGSAPSAARRISFGRGRSGGGLAAAAAPSSPSGTHGRNPSRSLRGPTTAIAPSPDSVVDRDRRADQAQVQRLGKWLGQQVMEEDLVDALM